MIMAISKERDKHEISSTKDIDTVEVNKICTVANTGRKTRREGGNEDEDGEKNKRMNELCWRPEEIITK
jgi:hypothetical protein